MRDWRTIDLALENFLYDGFQDRVSGSDCTLNSNGAGNIPQKVSNTNREHRITFQNYCHL